jgi:hypothetical protein
MVHGVAAVVRPVAGFGHLWKRKKTEACEGEGKLAVGVVGVAGERAATLAVFGKEKGFWARCWPLLLLLLLLRLVTVAGKKIFTEEREREVVQPPREMV